jgi:uncharacterized protein YkwD
MRIRYLFPLALVLLLPLLVATPAQSLQQPTVIAYHVNSHRAGYHHLPRLRWDNGLALEACRHARAMAAAGRIFHRAIRTSRRWSWLGQNVGYTTASDLGSLFYAYHASPGHRAVLQSRYASSQGDCAVRNHGRWYHVHDFARFV